MTPTCSLTGRRLPGVALLALLAALVGCGGPADLPPTYPVRGKVVGADGRPLEGGTINFVPSPPDPAITVTGTIDADGRFTLCTIKGSRKVDGAPEGKYEVTVVPPTPPRRRSVAPVSFREPCTVKAGENDLPPFTLATAR